MPPSWLPDRLARSLAAALLSGEWTRSALAAQARAFAGPRGLEHAPPLTTELLTLRDEIHHWSIDDLAAWLRQELAFVAIIKAFEDASADVPIALSPPLFRPAPVFANLDILKVTSNGDLAAWLGLSAADLDWFSDARCQHGRSHIANLQHYTYRFMSRRRRPARLIEAPKPRMKTLQRHILREIISKVTPHDAAHGFVARRSVLTHAARHASEAVVITADLENFFLSTRLSRVQRMFCALGYPPAVAATLMRLCSTTTPQSVLDRATGPSRSRVELDQYRTRHLPQGAPTSPALANLCTYGLDVRLAGLARTFGAAYSRYADDLAFSGDEAFESQRRRFLHALKEIVSDCGYRLNTRKTRVMRAAVRQEVTGLTVNTHIAVRRADVDRLKAILTNCVRHGPASQNHACVADFPAHLSGRVGWVKQVDPKKGAKLRALFDAIDWSR